MVLVYCSLTGNTKRVGEAIAKSLNIKAYDLKDISEAKFFKDYEKVIFGCYIDKAFMGKAYEKNAGLIKGKKMGIFITLGAEPDGVHAKDSLKNIKEFFIKNGNEISKEFACQGAIDEKVIEAMLKMAEKLGENAVHKITPERKARWERAKSHPDENDIKNAIEVFRDF